MTVEQLNALRSLSWSLKMPFTPDKANQEHGRLNEGLQYVLKQRRKKKSPVMYRGGLQCLIIICSL